MSAHKRSSVPSTGGSTGGRTSSYAAAVPLPSGVPPSALRGTSAGPLTAAVFDHERGEEGGDATQRRALVEADVLEQSGVTVEHPRRAVHARQPHDVEVVRDVHHRPTDAVHASRVHVFGEAEELVNSVEVAQTQIACDPVAV